MALAAACLALAWIFAKLGSEVLEGELFGLDQRVHAWMLAHRSPALMSVFRVVTHLGAKEVLAPIALLAGWRLFRDTRRAVALLGFAALACGEFVALLKRDLHVIRPAGGISAGLGFSFPSGHAAGSMALAVVFSYVAVRKRIHAGLVATVCFALTILVGVSRVYLDVHWTSDVLGGWLVGAAFGAGTCAIYEWMRRLMSDDHEPSRDHGTAGAATGRGRG